MSQIRTSYILNGTNVPALATAGEMGDSVVIMLHGSEVSKEVNQTDMDRLEAAGFWSVCIDAPHHGERSDGYMELAAKATPKDYYLMMLAVVHQEAAEVAELVKHFKSLGKKVAVVGISMGGYAAFATMMLTHEPDLFATFMGNPDFGYEANSTYSLPELACPAKNIDFIFPTSILMVIAGKDTYVNPNGARNFYKALKPYYESAPERLELFEFPESDHFMREQDWFAGWEALVNRLRREGF